VAPDALLRHCARVADERRALALNGTTSIGLIASPREVTVQAGT